MNATHIHLREESFRGSIRTLEGEGCSFADVSLSTDVHEVAFFVRPSRYEEAAKVFASIAAELLRLAEPSMPVAGWKQDGPSTFHDCPGASLCPVCDTDGHESCAQAAAELFALRNKVENLTECLEAFYAAWDSNETPSNYHIDRSEALLNELKPVHKAAN